MGYYSRKRNIRKFWKNPLVNLCYTLSVLAFVAGLFGIAAVIGGADTLLFAILMFVAGVLLIILGKNLRLHISDKTQESNTTKIRKSL